jgi:serine/threonine-protein kinase
MPAAPTRSNGSLLPPLPDDAMHQPPPPLIALLAPLGLAGSGAIRKAEKYVRRLARDLPQFDSVWIDALAQARLLTRFQAAELNAGRGALLRVGPYVLCQPLAECPWIHTFRARHVDTGEGVRLAVAAVGNELAASGLRGLEGLVAAAGRLPRDHVAPIFRAGGDGGRLWAASPWIDGRTAAQWLVHRGRFPPPAVLEIARAMTAGLTALAKLGLCHGDVAAQSLLLTAAGDAVLLQPGLRAILRPEEGYAQADLPPEAYDYLAPERIAAGGPPDRAADVYACGCLWWHLLCGRPPLAGGDSLAKLQAAQAAAIEDVRRLAPEAPAVLAEAIAACVRRDPRQRPESMVHLAELLGRPSRTSRQSLARSLRQYQRAAVPAPVSSRQAAPRTSQRMAAAVLALMAVVAAVWSLRPWWNRAVVPPVPARQIAPRAAGFIPAVVPPVLAQARPAHPDRPADLLLDGKTACERWMLQPGQRVRGAAGKRPTVAVPPAGLVVAADGVSFANIDFVWRHSAAQPGAIIQLRAAHGAFRGCTFQAAGAARPAAIAWTHPSGAAAAATALPSGRLQLRDCVFCNVAAALQCHTLGALGVEMANTLHLGTGAVMRLDHFPAADEPLSIRLDRVTLRGTGPLLQCDGPRRDDGPAAAGEPPPGGEIAIEAAGCILAPAPGQALLLLSGRALPPHALAGIQWTGQGSLVSPETPIIAWRRPDGGQQPLDESGLSMAGLVRGAVAFAGRGQDGPAASQVLHWQAPLQSSDPPGVDAAALPQGLQK